MNNHSATDFFVDRENKTITVKREFNAELPLVWDAYTKSEILDQWWAPKPWKAKTKKMDFKEGGQWLYSMVDPNGEEHWSIEDYVLIQDKKKFTWLDAFSDSEGNINKDMPRSEWEVNFTDNGKSTLVEILISYDDLDQLDATLKMGFKEGLIMAMDNLDDLLPSLKK